MGARISSGFTIIETMLFLAVTGLLIMGALIGTGSALSNQRYRDAVETFKTLVQTQYAELGSVKNDRTNTWTCGADAKPVAGGELRGQSDCLIVGRYMRIDQSNITIYTVLAHEKTGGSGVTQDVAKLKNKYTYNVVGETETHTMEWGTEIAWPTEGAGAKNPQTPASLGILFMRSPESGRVYTFSSDSVPARTEDITSATFTDMINEDATTPNQAMGERTICVKSGGLILGGDRSIYLTPRAASSGAVEVRTNDMEGAARC